MRVEINCFSLSHPRAKINCKIMNYKEAEKIVQERKSLIGQKFQLPQIGVYGHVFRLVIAPENKGSEVLKEWVFRDCDNITALTLLGLLNEDLRIIVIGFDNKVLYPQALEDYLSTNGLN